MKRRHHHSIDPLAVLFLGIAIVVAVSLNVVATLAYGEFHAMLLPRTEPWLYLASVIVFALSVYIFRQFELISWLLALIAAFSANLLASSLTDLSSGQGSPSVRIITALGCLVLFALILFWRKSTFFNLRALELDEPEPRRHLVLFLSQVSPSEGDCIPSQMELVDGEDIKDALERMVTYKSKHLPVWSWEMPLRGIYQHRDRLEGITIIASRKTVGLAKAFEGVVRRYWCAKKLTVQLLCNGEPQFALVPLSAKEAVPDVTNRSLGWDFEDANSLYRGLDFLIRKLKKQGIREKDIVIDFTGGQKVTSAIATAATFNRALSAQYVQTEPRSEDGYTGDSANESAPGGLRVRLYDIVLEMGAPSL